MATGIAPTPMPTTPLPPRTGLPQPKRWTVAEFHELGERGLFEGKRAMLIDGVILEQGPMNPPHAIATTLAQETLRMAFGTGWFARVQMPLLLGLQTDPEPDIAMVVGTPRDYTQHPTTSALVVEIADTSFAFDTDEKANLYAAGGIADYWVLDVNGRQLLVFRDPRVAPTVLYGHSYATRLTFTSGQAVAPLAAPNAPVAVSDLLP